MTNLGEFLGSHSGFNGGNNGTLVARDEAEYRSAVDITAGFAFELNDERALRKQLRFIAPGEAIPELEPALLVPMSQALEDVREARRKRNQANREAERAKGFMRAAVNKRRRAGGGE